VIGNLFAIAAFALIPTNYFDCVVAIGRNVHVIEKGVQWEPIASGFLYGDPTGEKNDKEAKTFRVFLVTNRHVVQGLPEVILRFNPKESKPAKQYAVPLLNAKGQQAWFAPPDPQVDVSVIRIDLDFLRNDGIKAEFFTGDDNSADVAKMKELGVSEGDGVFVLGFPLQLVGGERNFVIARQGIIARIADLLDGYTKSFLLDTFIFPGNSGGPVIIKPDLASIRGTKAQTDAQLIGLVSSFETYQDVAVSQQTGRPRITFEENAGLANVIPVDQIRAAIAEADKAEKPK
jgi:S1-C subfamily serine protease